MFLSGTSTSTIFLEGVVARLIGPLATFPSSSPSVQAAVESNTPAVMVQRVGGGFSSPFYARSPSPSSEPRPPFRRFPHGYRFPPELEEKEITHQPSEKTKTPLLQEIFSVAFASHSLAAQARRSGFLFFPLPAQAGGNKTLTWDWYDCTTKALVAHFTVPFTLDSH